MQRGERPPGDQAEVVFSEAFVEQLGERTADEQHDVLAEVVRLRDDPAGKHPLQSPLAGWNTLDVLAGWNTLDVLAGHKRVVYKASIVDGTGLIEVLCLGPRTDNEISDMAVGLSDAGLLEPDEVTDLWDALAVLEIVEEEVGLDGWDFRPPPAPDGMVRAVVAANLLDERTARALSKKELEAAMAGGWGPEGPDPKAAITAALEEARKRSRRPRTFDADSVIAGRWADRCGAAMPRAGSRCIRRKGHPGAHRAR